MVPKPGDTETAGQPPEVAPVRPGQDLPWDRLAAYLRSHLDDLRGEPEVLQFPNGSANLTYLLRFEGDRRLVVRRPPFGRLAPGAHDMAREFRVLVRLSQHFDRAPHAYLFCDDHSVVGADFVVMEYRVGEVVWGAIPASMTHYEDIGRRIGFAVVEALAELHLLDPAACGLADLGRPQGYVRRQVDGWRRRWELAATDDADPAVARVGLLLDESLPNNPRSSLLHNDFKVDNCQFDPTQPDRVRSIFDWDMATIGDPLTDLGTLLNYWPDPADRPGEEPVFPEGMDSLGLPTRAEIVERYGQMTGFPLESLDWYQAFACFKVAVILQQLYARHQRGETTDERMGTRNKGIARQGRRALRFLSGVGSQEP